MFNFKLIGVTGTIRGIVEGSRVTKLKSALKKSQPSSALMFLHLKILNTLTELMCLHLNMANQELGSPAVCRKKGKIGIGSTFYRALPSTFKKFTRIYH